MIIMNLSPETTCLDRPHSCGQWGGLSRQVLPTVVLVSATPLSLCSLDPVEHVELGMESVITN